MKNLIDTIGNWSEEEIKDLAQQWAKVDISKEWLIQMYQSAMDWITQCHLNLNDPNLTSDNKIIYERFLITTPQVAKVWHLAYTMKN